MTPRQMRGENPFSAWVSPGRRIERLDPWRGEIECIQCGTVEVFRRADNAVMTNAELATGWQGWACQCPDASTDPDPNKWPVWSKPGHHRPKPGQP